MRLPAMPQSASRRRGPRAGRQESDETHRDAVDRSSDVRRRRDRGRAGELRTVHGEAQKLGNGLAQIYAELDAEGAPRVIGVSFDQSMLAGLPEMPDT